MGCAGIRKKTGRTDPVARAAAFIILVLFVISTLTIRAMAMAPRPKKETEPSPTSTPAPARAEIPVNGKYLFTPDETITIQGYFRTSPPPAPAEPPHGKKKKELPPGLKKKVDRGGELPPGWQKKVARGEVIDAGVYARSRPLPPELVKRLPPQPRGTIVVTIEGKAVRLMEATLTILDVFDLL
jgi:hypothetical protein